MSVGDMDILRVIDTASDCPEIPLVIGTGNAKVVMWPGNGAKYRTFHLVDLGPGAKTISLQHDNDSVYYVIDGSGAVVDLAAGDKMNLAEGAMVHIGAGDSYMFEAQPQVGLKILGGPCPADQRLYDSLKTDIRERA